MTIIDWINQVLVHKKSWDSFNGLVLVDELDNHFKVKFTISEITDVKNVADIKRHLKNYDVS